MKTLRFGRSTITSTEWTQSQLSHSKPSGSLDFVSGDRGRHTALNFSRISCLCLGADRIYLIKVLVNQHHGDKEHRHPGSPPGHALIHALDRLDEYQDQEGETVIRRQIFLNRTCPNRQFSRNTKPGDDERPRLIANSPRVP